MNPEPPRGASPSTAQGRSGQTDLKWQDLFDDPAPPGVDTLLDAVDLDWATWQAVTSAAATRASSVTLRHASDKQRLADLRARVAQELRRRHKD